MSCVCCFLFGLDRSGVCLVFFVFSFALGHVASSSARLDTAATAAAVLLQFLIVFQVEVFEFAPDFLVLKLTFLQTEMY